MPEGCWRFQCWCELQIFANEPVKNSSWCIPVFWNFPWFFTAELSEQMSGDAQSVISSGWLQAVGAAIWESFVLRTGSRQ